MRVSSPRGWPYSASSSPEPLPKSAWLQDLRLMFPLREGSTPDGDEISAAKLLPWIGSHTLIGEEGPMGDLDSWLEANNSSPMEERRLFLTVGEMGNPYRLADIGIVGMPMIPVRIDGLCRTWIDTMDSREVQPGIHHVTLARTEGWWERTLLAIPDIEQMRKMTDWLNAGSPTNWRWSKLAEGSIHITPAENLQAPTQDMLVWDGDFERVEQSAPNPQGPALNLSEVTVPLFTRQGIYDHRGRIARCVHFPQRKFHNDLYRRGSSKPWNSVISTQ
jgi:hypothetical protein